MVLFIIIYSFKKINIYSSFLSGVNDSFKMIINFFPSMFAMILAINLFNDSGLLNFFITILRPILKLISFPEPLISMALIRPISGSASLALLNNIYKLDGPDSLLGIMGSVMQGSTDTTMYILAVYFGSIGIKKVKYAYFAGLFADLIGIITSIALCNLFF